jgi:molybdopterin synthase catalytic subunit
VVSITSNPIDINSVMATVRDRRAGAVVLFLGTVREFTGDRQTSALNYEAFEEMALASLQQITEQAKTRWSLVKSAVVHRTGSLDLGAVAVAVAVSSAHRGPAFDAGQWIMDRIKQQTPIWKKEIYSDGRTEWVHPNCGVPESSPPDADSMGILPDHIIPTDEY